MPKETPEQPRLISESGSEYKITPEEQSRKDEYSQRLRDLLNDPDFQKIPGFPIGEDEAILELSDPPHYTACPNPFITEIIENWQLERTRLRNELGLPVGDKSYHREPFTADVTEGKNDRFYQAHTYHTKVPYKAIMRYLLHYTEPGDIVLDGFSGTGMTGLATQLCSDSQTIKELGYLVNDLGEISDSNKLFSLVGKRKAILIDLSTAATFIAFGFNININSVYLEEKTKEIEKIIQEKLGWMYETWHPNFDSPGKVKGKINYVVWSDVFSCPQCGHESIYWDQAVDENLGKVKDIWNCPECATELCKTSQKESSAIPVEKAWDSFFDKDLGSAIRQVKKVPVLIHYKVGSKTHQKKPDKFDFKILRKIDNEPIDDWYPTLRMPDGDESRRNDDIGYTHTHHFFTKRNLRALAYLHKQLGGADSIFTSLLYRSTRLVMTVMSNYFAQFKGKTKGGWAGKPLSGTLYVPSISTEVSILSQIKTRSRSQLKLFQYKEIKKFSNDNFIISTQSSTILDIPTASVDYIFTDPPFGSNLMYSELNYFWEGWLKVLSNNVSEAIINKTQLKGFPQYQSIMEKCFVEFNRVLKPGKWITVEFHNSQNRVWNVIQEAIMRAGFIVADVSTLDKKQGSFKQVTSQNAVKQDLIISAYKPTEKFIESFFNLAGSENGVWEFVRQHLNQIPIFIIKDNTLEVINERQQYLLYDRMVAFHIQRGASIPLSAADFYAGLEKRFPMRDGMFFLPDQVPEYDKARLKANTVSQLALFVTDEKTSIQWLSQRLNPLTDGKPQTYPELQPKYLQLLQQARHEQLPELTEILEQNFLQDDQGRWYVPDPNKASDLEKIRNKALLREFNHYIESRGRLNQFRTEAIRAGFADAWQRKDFGTIVEIANRLPETVLQEDPDLLMYYDNASLRSD